MASGPYQSNLLRFFVGQYWQGLARHRRVVREARSMIRLGSEFGFAVALSPVAFVIRTSQKRIQQLSQSVTKLRSSVRHSPSSTLLDFSGFDRLLAVSDRLNFKGVQPLLKALQHQEIDAEEIGLSTHRMSGWDASSSESLLDEALLAEVAMAQTLLSIDNCLLPPQIDQLARKPARWLTLVLQGWNFLRRAPSIPGWNIAKPIASSRGLVDGDLEGVERSNTGRITGVASDLKTRSLVLVLNHVQIWNGLNQTQQNKLQQSIGRFITNDADEETTLRAQSIQPSDQRSLSEMLPFGASLSVVKAAVQAQLSRPVYTLERPLISFWVAVLQVLGHLRIWETPTTLPQAAAELADTIEKGALRQPSSWNVIERCSPVLQLMADGMVDRRQPLDLEATVVAVDYIVHPLERFLKWVDKILLWVETQWRVLKGWLS